MASVWAVEDDEGNAAALKIMNRDAGREVAHRLVREHRTLTRLHHPNIVAVRDGGTWEGRPWYAMERVAGEDLRAMHDRWSKDGLLPPPEERCALARRVLLGVAHALAHIHAQGIVHRDVTPGNIRVLPDGAVRLMDFGVVKEQGSTELTAHGELLGTVAYVAPEQISGDQVDGRADLYSLGAVLYVLLTGRRPFQARTLAGYLDKHLHDTARPPSEVDPAVPADLDAICVRLLQKDPEARFGSAQHLLRVLEGPPPGMPRLDGEWPPAVVGRTEDLAVLGAAIAAAREGHGGVIVLEGAAGGGKTRMARILRDQGRRAGLRVLAVRARESGNPLDVYARVYAAMQAEGGEPSPVLERMFGVQALSTPGVPIERFALFTAFRELFVGTPPRLCLVDDLHFADDGSLQLLEYLVRNTRALRDEPILWVFTRTPGVRDEAMDGVVSGAHTEVVPVRRALGPLRASAVEELVLGVVRDGPEARALATRLHADTEGNPAMLVEMIRGLADEGAFAPGFDGTCIVMRSVAQLATGAMPVPRSLRARLMTALAARSGDAQALLRTLATALTGTGWPDVALAVVSAAAELDDAAADAALGELEDAGMVRVRDAQDGAHLELAQPRTRDLLSGSLFPEERRRLHRKVGEALERAYRRRMHLVVEALAAHFEAAGIVGKAYPYLILAGERLLARSFAKEAESYFQRAITLEPQARELITLEDADRLLCETLLRRAEALDHLGRWNETLPDLRRALALAEELGNDGLQARAWTELGKRARQIHDLDAGEDAFTRALAAAGRANLHGLKAVPLSGLAAVRWARGDLDGAERVWKQAFDTGTAHQDERGTGFGLNGLGLVALCRGQAAEARKHFEGSAEVFERIGMLGPLATARVNLVEIHHFTGSLKRGLELAEKTLAQARETGHLLGVARGRHHRAMLLVDLGRFAQGRDEAREALAIVRRVGQKEDELATIVGRLRADWALGDLSEVRQGLHEALGLLEHYDPEGFAPIVLAWCARLCAADGDLVRAHAFLARAREWPGLRWPYQEARFDLVLARVYAALGDFPEATRRAEAAIRRGDACGFRLYTLKGHQVAAACSQDEAAVARHRRVADALARSLAANLAREDAERFLDVHFVPDPFARQRGAR